MLKAEMAPCLVIALLLIATPTVADVTRELARCELEAERLYPAPHNKGVQNWPERATSQKAQSAKWACRTVSERAREGDANQCGTKIQPIALHLGQNR
jgi:hypothetical protein